ncbi:hypothetical protein AN958_03907 [Leucoagaricus sp. SymC.cos]|nr:hypothetical protein AN958_03907 [Leucoagaricus sp. SymC.cos]
MSNNSPLIFSDYDKFNSTNWIAWKNMITITAEVYSIMGYLTSTISNLETTILYSTPTGTTTATTTTAAASTMSSTSTTPAIIFTPPTTQKGLYKNLHRLGYMTLFSSDFRPPIGLPHQSSAKPKSSHLVQSCLLPINMSFNKDDLHLPTPDLLPLKARLLPDP